SLHHVQSKAHYESIYVQGFEQQFGAIKDWTVLALLPSYMERSGSSLVMMAQGMIERSRDMRSGFYLYNHGELLERLKELSADKKPTLLLGVTFALLDFADFLGDQPLNFPELRVMETGGMKGRKKEMIRAEVHAYLRSAFPASAIDSEYGMTELMSQAYMKDSGVFVPPDWMRVYTRDIADPLSIPKQNGSRGALNVIDLANIKSCAFLALADQGQVFENGTFEVYGRLDHSEIRGCNLMI
ncbi:MAG TPA: acyl transferase, partial [Cryomorphaceae bacterium]|nr:acyl transferase [Cryomorphaceae bacterium]